MSVKTLSCMSQDTHSLHDSCVSFLPPFHPSPHLAFTLGITTPCGSFTMATTFTRWGWSTAQATAISSLQCPSGLVSALNRLNTHSAPRHRQAKLSPGGGRDGEDGGGGGGGGRGGYGDKASIPLFIMGSAYYALHRQARAVRQYRCEVC